jgi:hypothetical protein
MDPWEFHEIFPCFYLKEIMGYPNEYPSEWRENLPKFDGIESHAIQHTISFLDYVFKHNVIDEDILIKLISVFSLEMKEMDWVSYCSGPRTISSCVDFVKVFFKHWGPHLQKFGDAFEEYIEALQEYKEESQVSKQEEQESSLDPIEDSMHEDQKSLKRMMMKKIKSQLLILSMKTLKIKLKVLLKAKDMRVKMKKHMSPLEEEEKTSLKSQLLRKRHLFHPPHHFMKKVIMLLKFINLTMHLLKNLKKSYVQICLLLQLVKTWAAK